jgi:hypothetical protein
MKPEGPLPSVLPAPAVVVADKLSIAFCNALADSETASVSPELRADTKEPRSSMNASASPLEGGGGGPIVAPEPSNARTLFEAELDTEIAEVPLLVLLDEEDAFVFAICCSWAAMSACCSVCCVLRFWLVLVLDAAPQPKLDIVMFKSPPATLGSSIGTIEACGFSPRVRTHAQSNASAHRLKSP